MKKVLIVVYNFPPQLTVAARRWAKFVKYLKEFGWQPIVVTVANSPIKLSDENLYREVFSVAQIYRTVYLCAFSFLKRKYLRAERLSGEEVRKKNILSYIANRVILKTCRSLLIDDSNRIGWFPLTAIKCAQIIKKEKIDLILTNSLPYSAHLVGYLLNKLTKIPWIADLREGWIFDKSLSIYDSRMNLMFNKWLCRETVRKARNVILPTPAMADIFKGYFKESENKILWLPTGYDEDDFNAVQIKKNGNKFTITYAGYFYSAKQLECFFAAINMLLAARPEIKDKIQIVFLSNLDKTSPRYEYIEKYGLASIVELHPILPRKQYVEYLMASDVLLFIHVSTAWSKVRLGTKTFDYIRAGKFILALVPEEGGVASLIRETKSGMVVDLQNTISVKNALSDLFDKFKRNQLVGSNSPSNYERYEVRNIVRELSEIFDRVR